VTEKGTCPICGGTDFTQDTDDFDRGDWGLFRCETCFADLREEERRFPDGSSQTTGRMVQA
jgi:hypothetical protein